MFFVSSPNPTSHISNPLRHVLVLVGPTASGKTAVSLLVAKRLDIEIISADSRQVYKLMDIGTAKPTPEQLRTVKHYFVDELLPEQDFNAGEFGRRGREIIDDIVARGKIPFVVGGSGLYVQALIDGFFEGPSADPDLRSRLYKQLRTEGAEKLLDELRVIDPASAAKMLPSNPRRIIRALEVYQLTGVPISEIHKSRIDIDFMPVFVGLRWERQQLYERINNRVDDMLRQGLVDEVKRLKEMGYSSANNALMTTGYMEVFPYLSGEIEYDRMVYLIKRNTRRYAKRQLTWFRRDERIRWFDANREEDFGGIAVEIVEHFKKTLARRGMA